MGKRLSVLVLGILSLVWLTGVATATDITNPLLKKLIEKGILTQEEAISVMEEIEKERPDPAPQDGKDLEKLTKALRGFKFEGLWYLSYQNGETDGEGYNKFAIKRGYLTVKKEILPWLKGRITLDITTAPDETDKLAGSVVTRLKYLYGQFDLPNFALFTMPFIEIGMVHMPWLDFEERINFYRCQDTMFTERNKLFNSADIGLTFFSLLGGEMDERYQKKVSKYYPGRYGSMSFGIYNGGGYHAEEKNENKVLEGRLTLRPLPEIIPGLQLSYFGITGKGNKDTNPDWNVNLGFVSYEHEYLVLTGQYYWGKGNQKGDDENDKDGYSFFTELKPHKKFSIIGRYDYFDPNDSLKNDENERYIVGVAYHLDKQHKNMILLDYDAVKYKEAGKSDDRRVQATLQIKF